MRLSRERRAFLVEQMGETRVAALEKGLEEKEEALKATGIAYKEAGSLRGTFDAIIGNIMAAQLTAGEKTAKVKAATAEMEKRMNVLGRREDKPENKCVDCGLPMVEVAPTPLAGATSFAEAEKFDEAEETESYVGRLERRFGRIVDNIFGTDAGLDKKVAQVKHAVAELGNRLKSPQRQKALTGSKAGPPLSEFAQGSGQEFGDYDEDLSLGVFGSIVDTIVGDHQLSPDGKVVKLQGAVADLRVRLHLKALKEAGDPGARALAQFIGPSARARPAKEAKELKEMAESPNPGARALAQIVGASGPGRQG